MILDVSQRNEYHDGHIKGALNIEPGEFQKHLDGLPREIRLIAIRAAGMRASIVDSIRSVMGEKTLKFCLRLGPESGLPRAIPRIPAKSN